MLRTYVDARGRLRRCRFPAPAAGRSIPREDDPPAPACWRCGRPLTAVRDAAGELNHWRHRPLRRRAPILPPVLP